MTFDSCGGPALRTTLTLGALPGLDCLEMVREGAVVIASEEFSLPLLTNLEKTEFGLEAIEDLDLDILLAF